MGGLLTISDCSTLMANFLLQPFTADDVDGFTLPWLPAIGSQHPYHRPKAMGPLDHGLQPPKL
jgi:hypothetical protein